MTTSTVVPSALQLVDGREESTYNSLKRSSSSSFGSDSLDSPSPGKTARKPMRKRAKTQEEKEERAQERIMRNRAAAQVSRERKREHMVLLEQENEQLHLQIKTLSGDNATLRNTVDSLSQRLENMERMMALFTAPGTTSIIDHNTASTSPVNLDNAPPQDECSATTQTFYCPTPPGTIRPQDLISNPSTPFMETLDSRNPAASNIDEVSMEHFFSLPNLQANGDDPIFLDDYPSRAYLASLSVPNNDYAFDAMCNFPEAILA